MAKGFDVVNQHNRNIVFVLFIQIRIFGDIDLDQIKLFTPGPLDFVLCDDAKDEIERSGGEEFDLVEINIAEDPDLYEQYKHDIPVVLIDDVEAFRHRLTAREFLLALRQNS